MLKRISVVALTVTLLFGFSMTAFADIRADARYYRTGMALLNWEGRRWSGGSRKKFSLMPHPNTLLTLARVFEQLKDWERLQFTIMSAIWSLTQSIRRTSRAHREYETQLNPKPASPASLEQPPMPKRHRHRP